MQVTKDVTVLDFHFSIQASRPCQALEALLGEPGRQAASATDDEPLISKDTREFREVTCVWRLHLLLQVDDSLLFSA